MKKFLFIMGLTFLSLLSNSQSQAPTLWWKLDGTNNASPTSAIGTANNEPLRFKSNSTEWMQILPNGEIFLNRYTAPLNALLGVKDDGLIYKIDYTGNHSDVLRGDGTFGSFSGLTGWNILNNVIYSDLNKNVGIGSNIAPEKLTVGGNILTSGNILAAGSISGTSLNVIDIVTSGKEFKISTSLCMKGIDQNTPGSRNELCGMNGDLFIQSEANNNYNTVFAYDNESKIGFGVLPTENFHVGLQARFDKNVYTKKIYTNRITSEDTIIYFGDSTILLEHPKNKINWSNTSVPSKFNPNVLLPVHGLTIGRGNSIASGNNSIAIGTNVTVSGANSVVIGSGNSSNGFLSNNESNSLMIGFNSNLPTLYVSSSDGMNETGEVGIGTTCIPDGYKLAVRGKIMMEEATVRLTNATGCWPDFVFEENYQRMDWKEKTTFLKENKHLPYMPSANEVESFGLNIGTGMAAITQNVEENTLDILDLYKKMQAMENEIERLKLENRELKEKMK